MQLLALRKKFCESYLFLHISIFLHFFAFDFDLLLGQGPWDHKLSEKPIHVQTFSRILGARAEKPVFRDLFKTNHLLQISEFTNEIIGRVFDALQNLVDGILI